MDHATVHRVSYVRHCHEFYQRLWRTFYSPRILMPEVWSPKSEARRLLVPWPSKTTTAEVLKWTASLYFPTLLFLTPWFIEASFNWKAFKSFWFKNFRGIDHQCLSLFKSGSYLEYFKASWFNKVSFFADVSNFLSLRAKQDKHRNQEAWGDLKTV